MRLENNDGARLARRNGRRSRLDSRESTKQLLWIYPLKFYANTEYRFEIATVFDRSSAQNKRCEENGVSVNTAIGLCAFRYVSNGFFYRLYRPVGRARHDRYPGRFSPFWRKQITLRGKKLITTASSGFFCGKQCQHMVPYMRGGRNILSCGIQMNIHFFSRAARGEKKIPENKDSRAFSFAALFASRETAGRSLVEDDGIVDG